MSLLVFAGWLSDGRGGFRRSGRFAAVCGIYIAGIAVWRGCGGAAAAIFGTLLAAGFVSLGGRINPSAPFRADQTHIGKRRSDERDGISHRRRVARPCFLT